jgi:hypothetical protein
VGSKFVAVTNKDDLRTLADAGQLLWSHAGMVGKIQPRRLYTSYSYEFEFNFWPDGVEFGYFEEE